MITRKTLLAGGILLAYSLLLSRAPLLNYLGYEFSAAVALMLPLVPGLFLLSVFARSSVTGGSGQEGSVLEVSGLIALGLLGPLFSGWLNSFFVKNCSPGEGLVWFALLPGIGMIWIAALSYFCASVFRRRALWYIVIVSFVMLHPVLLGYLTPRIDSYNFIYGYFPGFTYDEDLSITRTLFLWRGVTLVCALWLVSAARMQSAALRTPISMAVFVITLAALVATWFFRTEIGFETTASSLQKTLGSSASTRHFRLYYDSTAIPAEEIRWVAAEHEFRYDQVSRILGTDTNQIIESYIYPDAVIKRGLIGAGNTDIAKPWRGEIHLEGHSWRFTLKHELVHALASEFGMPVIRANINVGLVEGLAMAASPSFGNRTLQEYAASMIHFGIVDDPAALISPAGFAFQSSTVSYVLMGAFCEYLIKTHGIASFKTWYGGGSPLEAYGKSADSLIAEWRVSLEKIQIPESWGDHTDYYFRRGSIFSRDCARIVANINTEAARSLEKRDFVTARRLFERALDQNWNIGSIAGIIRSLLGSGDYGGVIRMFEIESRDSSRKGSLAGYRLLLGDALLLKGDHRAAQNIYREIRALDLSPGLNEAVALRLTVVETPDLREYLAPYIAGTMDDSSALDRMSKIASMDNPALLAYVHARILLMKNDYVSAAQESANYFAPFAYPELNGAMNDVTAAAFFRLGDFLTARVFFERSLEYGPGETMKARVRDRVERCEWFGREWEHMGITTW